MHHGSLDVRVLVKGRQVTEFQHQGQIFIEGRPGSDFEIQVTNKSLRRALAVISVDGLSIMDGTPASEDSSGYLVEPHGSVTIPGWMLDNSQVAKFTFGSRKDSYAQQGKGNATNCGVIGVMLFAEKAVPQYAELNQHSPLRAKAGWGSFNPGPMLGSFGGTSGSVGIPQNGMPTASLGTAALSADQAYLSTTISGSTVTAQSARALESAVSQSVNNLGTEFGQAAEFKSQEVPFEKGMLLSTVVMFYDDARGLKARGIVIERPSRQRYTTTPNPFPASTMGCKPPKNWRT